MILRRYSKIRQSLKKTQKCHPQQSGKGIFEKIKSKVSSPEK